MSGKKEPDIPNFAFVGTLTGPPTIDFAQCSTAESCGFGISGTVVAWNDNSEDVSDPIVENLQLAFWKEAKNKYTTKILPFEKPKLSDSVMTIHDLANSVLFLFGANNPNDRARESSLSSIANAQPWKLRKRARRFFPLFDEFSKLHTELLKHPTRPRFGTHVAPLTREKVTQYMRLVHDVWLWFIDDFHRRRGVPVPPEQLVEFRDEY